MATQAADMRVRPDRRDLGIVFQGWFRFSLGIWIPVAVLILIIGACFLGPILFNVANPNVGQISQARMPPLTAGHLLGTDALGDDVLSRTLHGGRVSVVVGLGSVALGLVVGGVVGMFAGYRGGITDAVITRVLDMFLAFPSLVLAIAVATYLGPSERNVIFAIAFFTVPAFARLARANTLRLRNLDFMVAADLIGQRERRIIFGHVVPNVLPSLVTFGLLSVAVAMILEAALDYLGVGVRPPQPSWGAMIAAGQTDLQAAPWIVFVPGAFLFVTAASLNLLGDAVRARWDSA